MDAAGGLENRVWEQFSAIEAEGIKQRLSLPECGDLDAHGVALNNPLHHLLKEQGFHRPDSDDPLLFAMKTCRVQAAAAKGVTHVPLHNGRAG